MSRNKDAAERENDDTGMKWKSCNDALRGKKKWVHTMRETFGIKWDHNQSNFSNKKQPLYETRR